jgi:hypothetical protein
MNPKEFVKVASEPESPDREGYYHVRLTNGGLVGTVVHPPGASVQLPRRVAIEAVKCGGATPHGMFASVALGHYVPKGKTPAPDDFVGSRPPGKRVKVLEGHLFQDGRSYGPEDGFFEYRGDYVSLLAMQTAEPGSLAESSARQTSRNRPKIALEGQLSPDERKRLSRLRKNPVEPTKAEIAKAVRLMALASE